MICDSPYYVLPSPAAVEKVPVPCGKCPNCKLRRVNGWVFRCLKEAERSTSSLFVTLTYGSCPPLTPNGWPTLLKSDFQDFMKRLRKLCLGSTLKYYACGEYGSKRKRPHYHCILFNVPDPALIADAWSLNGHSLGITQAVPANGDTIAYCMKYIDKPGGAPLFPNWRPFVGRDDRLPEFALMSKRLGDNYLTDDVKAYHKADVSRMFLTKPGGHTIAMPRYYRDKIYTDDEKKLQSNLAQAIADKQDLDERREFSLIGYPTTYTYEAWKSSKRFGRHKLFYQNQTPRSND